MSRFYVRLTNAKYYYSYRFRYTDGIHTREQNPPKSVRQEYRLQGKYLCP